MEIERENLEDNIELGILSGETLDAVMKMDMKKLTWVYRGYLRRRENLINDFMHVGHTTAFKIAQAYSEANKFSEPIKAVKLVARDEEIEDIVEMANNFNMKPDVLRKQLLKG
jgi:hypothetical protein